MNTAQLESFIEVAGSLSFSRAATRLNVSQPTVSHQIKALENELDTTLMTRSTRTVRLTDEGMLFLGYAHEIMELYERARAQVAHRHKFDAHTLRIGVHNGLEAQLIASSIGRMHHGDPDLDPQLHIGPHPTLLEMLEGGTVDLVLSYRDPAGEPAGATAFRRLAEVPASCVCGAGHPLAAYKDDKIDVARLSASGRIAVGDPRMTAAAIVDAQRAVGMDIDPHNVSFCPNVEAALALAAAGVAYTIIADIPAMHRPALRFIPITGTAPIVLGVRVRRGRQPVSIDRFIKILGEELMREP